MDPSIPRPTGLRGSPSGSPPPRDATGSGPIPGVAEEEPRRSRTGIARWPRWSRKRIGWLLLGLIALPWLPIGGPPSATTPARRARGVGDRAIQAFAFAP